LPFALFIAAAVWAVLHLLMTRTALGLFIQTIGKRRAWLACASG
jgi:simple sugar transport system permease protein